MRQYNLEKIRSLKSWMRITEPGLKSAISRRSSKLLQAMFTITVYYVPTVL